MALIKDTPKIFEYLDYRKYIEDYLIYQKSVKEGFSKRYFTKLVGMNTSSSSFISAIVKGSRNLTPALRIKFSKAMKLENKQALFFDILVQFNQSQTMEEKNFFFKQLAGFRGSRAKVLEDNQLRYYSEWHHSAVWNFFGHNPRQKSPEVIAGCLFPAVTPRQVVKSIDLLLELGLIERIANGYKITNQHITTAPEVRSMAAKEYIKSMTQIGLKVFDEVPPAERQYNALMFHVSKKGFDTIKERIQHFQEELREIINSDTEEDRIYTLSMLLFPNSRNPDK